MIAYWLVYGDFSPTLYLNISNKENAEERTSRQWPFLVNTRQ